MPGTTTCKKCGNELPTNAPSGVCPRCLLQAGLLESSPEMTSAATDAMILTDSTAPSDRESDLPTLRGGSSSKDAPDPGEKVRYFGEYELLAEIARGGMGVVYRARQVRLNRIVALKMILAGQLAGKADVQRFHTEAEAAARLDHPGIVPIHEVGEHEGQHFFTMGFVEGGSLASRLLEGPFAPREAALLVQQIAAAVQYSHELGVIHRDLKPANILLDRAGQPRITDFGLAKSTHNDSGLTASGQVMGTPSYMPPEQAAGLISEIGSAADVYSLGAILYEMLVGRPPFRAATLLETLVQVRSQEPVAPSRLQPGLHRDLETICLKCLQKESAKRYESAAAMADDLGRFIDGEPIAARPVSQVERAWRWAKRKPALAGLMASVAVLIVAVVVVPSVLAVRLNVARKESDHNAGEARQNQKTAEANAIAAETQRQEAVKQAGIAKAQEKIASEEKVRAEKGEQSARRRYYAAQMNLAGQAAAQGHLGRVLELLESQRPRFDEEDLRSFEWYHLWQVCFRGQTRVSSIFESSDRLGHDAVYAAAVSPDGRLLAAGTRFARVRLYTLPSLEDAGEINASDTVWDVTFSPDSKTLAIADHTNVVKLWDVATRRQLKTLVGPPGVMPRSVSFSPDGNVLAVGHHPDVLLWDVATGKVRAELKTAGSPVAAFSRDGTMLAASDSSGNFKIWAWDGIRADERVLQQFGGGKLAFSPDGTRLVTGGLAARVWDTATGREVGRLPDESASIEGVAMSHDGKYVAYGTYDRQIKLWNLETNAVECRASRGPVHAVSFSPDDASLYTAGEDTVVRQWLVAAEAEPRVLARARVSSLAFAPTSDLLAAACRDGNVQLWDAAAGREVAEIEAHAAADNAGANAVAFSPDGKWLATGGRDSNVKLWEVKTWKIRRTLHQGPGEMVPSIAFAPDSLTLVAAHHSPVLGPPARLWDVASGTEKQSLPGQHWMVPAVAFSSDGQLVATGQQFGTVALWDARTGREVATLESRTAAHHNINSVAFSPDGKLLVSAGNEGTIKLWDVPGEQLRATLKGHSTEVRRVTFFPNGQTVASCARDGTVKLWDVATAQERASFHAHSAAVTGLAVSRDGTLLATAGEDDIVKLWHVSNEPAALASKDELDSNDPDSPVVQLRAAGHLHAASRYAEAEKAYQAAITRLQQLVALHPARPQYRTELANARRGLSATLQTTPGSSEQVAGELRLARDLLQALAAELPTNPKIRTSLALCQSDLASLLSGLGRSDDAEQAFQQARELYERLLGESPQVTEYQQGLVRLASLRSAHGRNDEAEQIYQRLLELRPDSPAALNNLAWMLVSNPDAKLRDPARAVPIARRAVELSSQTGEYWNTLGVAQYRARDWRAAIDSLERSMSLRSGGDSSDWFVMSMAYHQQRETIDARFWYDSAVEWMATHKPKDDELIRFRTEARSLLGRIAEEPPANDGPSSAAWWAGQGARYASEGAWDKSLVRFSRSVMLDPKNLDAWRGRGTACNKLAQWDQAISDFTAAIALSPNEAALWRARGDAQSNRLRPQAAIADYSRSLELQPGDWKTLVARSESYDKLNQSDKALADIVDATALNPMDSAVWATSFRRHLALRKWPETVAAFDKATELGAVFDHATRFQVSVCYRVAGDLNHATPEEAINAYRKGIAVAEQLVAETPKASECHMELFATLRHCGSRLGVLGREQERDEHFSKSAKAVQYILELARTDRLALVRFNLCIVMAAQPGQPDLAHWRDVALEAVKVASQDPDCWKSLGLTQYRLGEWQSATEAYRKSVDLRAAGDGQTWFHLAMAEWKLNNKVQAGVAFDRGVEWMEKHKPDPAKWSEAIHVLSRSEAATLLGRSLEDFERSIAANPIDPAPRLARARHFSALQQWEQAVADYSEALQLKLDDPVIWIERGNIYTYHLGQHDKAVSDYDEAIRLKPHVASAWGRRGRVNVVLGLCDKATADIEQAIKLESPVGEDWYWYVLLRLHGGKTDDYREICNRLVNRFGETKDGYTAACLARAWSLAPDALADPKRAVRFSEQALATVPKDAWLQNNVGLAHLRAAQYEQAVRRFRESLEAQWVEPLNWLGLALAYNGLGQADASREWFAKADQWCDPVHEQYSKSPPGTPAPHGHHWLEIQLLHAEAKKLIK